MRALPLKITGMTERELVAYTVRQLTAVSPTGSEREDADVIGRHLNRTLERLFLPTETVRQWVRGEFDPLLSSQHASFLYFLANTIWAASGDVKLPTRLFLLNKALHGQEVYFRITLPPVFLFVHTVGIVLVNTVYGNYFTAFQNSTVGRFGTDRPKIGAGVVMFAGSAVIGRCTIGERTVLSQGARMVNHDSPGHVTIFPSSSRIPVIKPGGEALIEQYYSKVDL